MKIFSFYRRKLDFTFRIKFINYKFFYHNFFLKSFAFSFKSAPGLSVGSFILLYTMLLRFSKIQPKKLFKSLLATNTCRKIMPVIHEKFFYGNLRGGKTKSKIFKFLLFRFNSHVQVVSRSIKEISNPSVSVSTSLYAKSSQQTFLGFSSHILLGIKFAEAYHSFFWKVTAPFFSHPNFRTQKELLFESQLLTKESFFTSELTRSSRNLYFFLAQEKLFKKNKILLNFVFSAIV